MGRFKWSEEVGKEKKCGVRGEEMVDRKVRVLVEVELVWVNRC